MKKTMKQKKKSLLKGKVELPLHFKLANHQLKNVKIYFTLRGGEVLIT